MATAETETTRDVTTRDLFCHEQGRAAALHFAESFRRFLSRGADDGVSAAYSHREFMHKFVDSFKSNFESEMKQCCYDFGSHTPLNFSSGSLSQEQLCGASDATSGGSSVEQRSFLQRLGSFKQQTLNKGRSLLFSQCPTDGQSAVSNDQNGDGPSQKIRLTKLTVEVIREGAVNMLQGDSLEEWRRGRLALLRTGSGRQFEFFSPAKSSRSSTGVFCSSIVEARETTALEMPDRENTFVMRADAGRELVLEADSAAEMRGWLRAVRSCMSPSVVCPVGPARPPAPLPPPPPPTVCAIGGGPVDAYGELHRHPWFHGTLSRQDAALLVLQERADGHGTFLVRQSETRVGDYVLTFNHRARAKHVRLTISPQRQCRVQHLWFSSVFNMLEHFREQPIPLETGGSSDVTLGGFVLVTPRQCGGDSSAPPTPELRQVRTYAGSVRLRTESLERLDQQMTNGQRAVSNAYTFT